MLHAYKWSDMESISKKLFTAGQIVLAWLAFLLLLPFLLVVFGGLWLWKNLVISLIVKVFKRKFIKKFDENETVFAVDRYWENSRSSIGLIVELEGSLNVDEFRDVFRKKILDYPNSQDDDDPQQPKPFAKLTQIPVTFGGYYFWQKANYFLIHEHIRQINQPTDELGLKKAVGTLMTLPFPNRRPLWEILVYSNYLGTTTLGRGTTCGSVLFIRFHRAVTDSRGLVALFNHMLQSDANHAMLPVKSIQVGVSSKEPDVPPSAGRSCTFSVDFILEKITNLVYFPLQTITFAKELIKTPEGLVNRSTGETSSDASYADWTSLSEISIWKACASHSPKLSRSTIEMTLFLEGLTSRGQRHKCFNIPDEKGVPVPAGKCQTSVFVPYPHVPQENIQILSNDATFLCVKCPCIVSTDVPGGCNKGIFLKQVEDGLQKPFQKQLVTFCLSSLALLPRHLLRSLLLAYPWGAGYLAYEQFQMEVNPDQPEDLRVFGQHVVSQVIPLASLQWTHTVASAATLKWNDRQNVMMSLIASPGILGPLSEGNPQDLVESIVRGFPEELERLGDDQDHGFVSIPIS